MTDAASAPTCDAAAERAVLRRTTWRLVPFLFVLYIVAFLDRVNVGFAKKQLSDAIGLDAQAYGFCAGIFFLGYFLFEVPSNLILARFGARRWIARIMIVWGLLSVAMMFVRGPTSFAWMRFALGVAEAGFFPGIIYYLACWFPAAHRARIMAGFLAAIPMSNIIGAPLSGALLRFDGVAGLHGWQWLFLVEGLPAVVLGIATLFVLTDRPAEARWLSDAERATLTAMLARDAQTPHQHRLLPALGDVRVWLLSVLYFLIILGLYALSFWLPSMIDDVLGKQSGNVWVVAAIYAVVMAVMLLVGRSSDRRHERPRHVAVSMLLTALAMLYAGWWLPSPLGLAALTLACAGIYAALAPFWAIPTAVLRGTAAAGGIALINSFGNLAGYVGPFGIGWVEKRYGDHLVSLLVLAAAALVAAVLVLLIAPTRTTDDRA